MSTYKGMTPARAKASEKYLSEKVDTITVRIPKGKKAEIKKTADSAGISVNQFCVRAILEKLEENM